MELFTHPEFDAHEEIVFGHDRATGLRAIVAVHDTRLGPALGGCRMWPYAREADAVTDVLRLSRGMTLKSAAAGLALGGGKAVIIGDPRRDKTPALMAAMGRLVEGLGGRYVTAEDSGIGVADLKALSTATRHVVGIADKQRWDGTAHDGDPSPATAEGVFLGMRAGVRAAFGRPDLAGLRIAVQGAGSVGRHLARRLAAAGAQVMVADLDAAAADALAREIGGESVEAGAIMDVAADVFSPCAMGAVIDADSRARLRCRLVAGAANNQLATPEDGTALWRTGILYAPDFLLNAGGIIDVGSEYYGYDAADVRHRIESIEDKLADVFARSRIEGVPPEVVAGRLAAERLAGAVAPAQGRERG